MGGCLRGFIGILGVIFLIGVAATMFGGNPKTTSTSSSTTRSAAATPPPAPVFLKPTWRSGSEKSKLDDSTNVWLTLESNDNVSGRFVASAPAELTIRCMENKTAVYFQFADHFLADIQGYGTITYRIDQKPARKQEFSESTDNQALGLWSGGASIPFAKSLFGGETMFVRAVPYNESPVDVEFNIKGLAEEIAPLRKACGW